MIGLLPHGLPFFLLHLVLHNPNPPLLLACRLQHTVDGIHGLLLLLKGVVLAHEVFGADLVDVEFGANQLLDVADSMPEVLLLGLEFGAEQQQLVGEAGDGLRGVLLLAQAVHAVDGRVDF